MLLLLRAAAGGSRAGADATPRETTVIRAVEVVTRLRRSAAREPTYASFRTWSSSASTGAAAFSAAASSAAARRSAAELTPFGSSSLSSSRVV